MTMNAIACLDLMGAIGSKNKLLFKCPQDLQRFKQFTINETIIRGRKTWESIGSKPLPNRTNIVLTHDPDFIAPRAYTTYTVDDVLTLAASPDKEIWIIGGQQIYNIFLPYCEKLYLTHMHTLGIDPDAYFPNIEEQWGCIYTERYPDHTFATWVKK